MIDKPQSCYDCRCPLATKGKGFVLGCGDPKTAKLAINLEAPGGDEVEFRVAAGTGEQRRFYATGQEGLTELILRRRDYPDMAEKFRAVGVPIVGMSAHELFDWAGRTVGLKRDELFIDNTLRCLPPKRSGSDEHYPKGEERKAAERCCRQYDRWSAMKPDVAVVSLHPAAILRDVTPLSLQVEDLKKARGFVAEGRKVVLLAGGKSAQLWLGACSNVTFWRGHYQRLADGLPRTEYREVTPEEAERLATGKRVRKPKAEKKPRVKLSAEEKLTRARNRRTKNREFLRGTILE